MDEQPLRSTTSTIDIYIKLAQYPILSDRIRERMREELFRRRLVEPEKFEEEVEQRAIESQRREGLHDPYNQEPAGVWHERKARIRALHTDFYFGYNLPTDLFEQIVQEVLHEQANPGTTYDLAFNPEIAPYTLLFRQGEIYEKMPPPEKERIKHHLQEIKVVLIKGMISDQLPYIAVAKQVFTIEDLRWIYQRRIGSGKIGGKAAGMLLAHRILQQRDPEFGADISQQVDIPESFFLGTDVLYEFRRMNNLDHLMNQKYRPLDEIRADYDQVIEAHLQGRFPPRIVERLREVLRHMGPSPIIVRSSSLLEDNFGHAFAGKYQIYFCPNQGSEDENLHELLQAISRIYASALNPDAILYRQHNGLLDYDERMAVLIQAVRGQPYGRYFMPTLAGVGYSQNPFRWHPKIRREDGFLRVVWGMGTRAVDRVSNDYPRMISLSHPQLRPEATAKAIERYSQHYVDVIDLEDNELKTLPLKEVLQLDYPYLRFLMSMRVGDSMQEILSPGSLDATDSLVLTLNPLTRDANFLRLFRTALRRLEYMYKTPVDIEFAVHIVPKYPYPEYQLQLLQCRPLSVRQDGGSVKIPSEVPPEDLLFRTFELIPDGKTEGIRYLLFVDPLEYRQVQGVSRKQEIGRVIGRLNRLLEGESFVLMGPGRWGSTNLDLGVRVSYADIFNTEVLIEMAVADGEGVPELSYGTHFFQDLVEGGIYSLPLHLENPKSVFNWDFFHNAPNVLAELLPSDAGFGDVLKVIDVARLRPDYRVSILMDGDDDEALGYLVKGDWPIKTAQVSLSNF